MDVLNISTGQLQSLSVVDKAKRRMLDFEYFDIQGYDQAGHTSLQFFRTQGQIEDMPILSVSGTTRVSNMVTSGKFDEPFLLTHIGLICYPGGVVDGERQLDTLRILMSGKLTLNINNTDVYWATPIGRAGSVINFSGFAGVFACNHLYLSNKPKAFEPPIYCPENTTVLATMTWSVAVATVSADAGLGIYLIGKKFFKGSQ